MQCRLITGALNAYGHDGGGRHGALSSRTRTSTSSEELRHEPSARDLKGIPADYSIEEWATLHRHTPRLLRPGALNGRCIEVSQRAKHDHFILLEYVEEFPLLLGVNGMKLRIETFVRQSSVEGDVDLECVCCAMQ